MNSETQKQKVTDKIVFKLEFEPAPADTSPMWKSVLLHFSTQTEDCLQFARFCYLIERLAIRAIRLFWAPRYSRD